MQRRRKTEEEEEGNFGKGDIFFCEREENRKGKGVKYLEKNFFWRKRLEMTNIFLQIYAQSFLGKIFKYLFTFNSTLFVPCSNRELYIWSPKNISGIFGR